jgi:hypothetical protein
VEEEADCGAVVDGVAWPLASPCTDGALDEVLRRLLPVRRGSHDLHGLLVGDHIPNLQEKVAISSYDVRNLVPIAME